VADSVAKVADEQLRDNNVQQSNRKGLIFESTLRIGPDLESMLLALALKIVLKHYDLYATRFAQRHSSAAIELCIAQFPDLIQRPEPRLGRSFKGRQCNLVGSARCSCGCR
jgi:hypothetical protein